MGVARSPISETCAESAISLWCDDEIESNLYWQVHASEIKTKIDLLLEQQTYMRTQVGEIVQDMARISESARRLPSLEEDMKTLRSRLDRMDGAHAGRTSYSGSIIAWMGLAFTVFTAGIHALIAYLRE